MAEKKFVTNTFEEAINTVIADEHISNKQVRYMLNCNVLSTASGNVGIVTNIKGNKIVSVDLPEGECHTIGSVNDEEENNFYYAVWNINGYHTWYKFNVLERKVTRILQCLTDTGGLQIFNWSKDVLINHINIVENNLLYWSVETDIARKINIRKCLDKSSAGYGTTILEKYTRAYKLPPEFAPSVQYATDLSKPFNRLYGAQYKFASLFIYDDNERSNYSDFSDVAKPDKEPFTGINTIPSENNCIEVVVQTGLPTVEQIEIVMMQTNPDGGVKDWAVIAVLDKKKLGITSNSTYTYRFYNDGAYSNAVQEKVNRPYSLLPKNPRCQAFIKSAMVYANFEEGFPDVEVDASVTVNYDDLFIDDGVVNQYNSPFFKWETYGASARIVGPPAGSGYPLTYYDGSVHRVLQKDSPVRVNTHYITIGADVKKGNVFTLKLTGTNAADNFTFSYTATVNDTAETIYYKLREFLISTGRIYRFVADDMGVKDIFNKTPISGGGLTFAYHMRATRDADYIYGTANVTPTQYDTLKDTGESVNNIKMGSTGEVGIMYEDEEGLRKSLVYTNQNLVYKVDPENTYGKIKAISLNVSINHKAPDWAKYFQIMLSKDLTYSNFIHILIQKVNEVQVNQYNEFLDLSIGSLITYQKMRENTTLKFDFQKGDRIRLRKYIDTEDDDKEKYYPFFETEIIAYHDVIKEEKRENIVVDGSNTVTVVEASTDNIGSYLRVNGVERKIEGVSGTDKYVLDNNLKLNQDTSDSKTFPYYEIINRDAVLRIKKPADIEIKPLSIIEVYKPSLNLTGEAGQNYFEVGLKFPIIKDSDGNLLHAGNQQDQTASTPAIIKVKKGTAYVRNREMPVSNVVPGTQVKITQVEDSSFSDFYVSNLNDLGRPNAKDIGVGVIHFGKRFRYSNNYIEDTKINGLNDFNNTDREDYNDKDGDVKRIAAFGNRLYVWKEYSTGWIPIGQRILMQADGTKMLSTTDKLLGEYQPFARDGGIGNNPEAMCKNDNHIYYASANTGAIIRLSLDGETPISEVYDLDNEFKKLLTEAHRNGTKIHMEYDRGTGNLIVSIEGSPNFIYVNTFDENNWQTLDDMPSEETEFTILTGPFHGELDLTDPQNPIYTPDEDYVGTDYFTYSAEIGGETVERRVDINVKELPGQYIWRVKASSGSCIKSGSNNTGYFKWDTLEKYDFVNDVVTSEEMPNTPDSPFYQAPIYDVESCPLPDPTVTRGFYRRNFSAKSSSDLPFSLIDENTSTVVKTGYMPMMGSTVYDHFTVTNDSGNVNVVISNDSDIPLKVYLSAVNFGNPPMQTFELLPNQDTDGIFTKGLNLFADVYPMTSFKNNSSSVSGGTVGYAIRQDSNGVTVASNSLPSSGQTRLAEYSVPNVVTTFSLLFTNTNSSSVSVTISGLGTYTVPSTLGGPAHVIGPFAKTENILIQLN